MSVLSIFVYLICSTVCLHACISVCLLVCLSVLSACVSVCLSVRLSVCLFTCACPPVHVSLLITLYPIFQVSSAQSNVEVQTDPTNGVSRRRSDDVNDRYHSNGGRKLRTNGTTAEDSAKLHRPLKPQDFRESSSHRGRTGPLKTQVPSGPVESSRNVVSSSPRGGDLQDHRGSDYSSNGVWISRPWGDEGSTLRGQRLDSVDSIPV